MRKRVGRGLMMTWAVAMVVACAPAEPTIVVRGADDIEVLSPAAADDMRSAATTTLVALVSTTPGSAGAAPAASTPAADTVPQNVDDRPAELKLFDAFAVFRGCIDDAGYSIEGDLTDPNNPAYQDSAYLDVVQTCAARSDIVNVLNEVQATRASLTPDEVESRNEAFVALEDCLLPKGWTIETRTNEAGLIEPVTFVGPDGSLNERDVDQCLSDTGILDAVEEGSGGA